MFFTDVFISGENRILVYFLSFPISEILGNTLKQNAIIIILLHHPQFTFNWECVFIFFLFLLRSSPKLWLCKYFISIYLDRGSAWIFVCIDPEGNKDVGIWVLAGFQC